MQPVLHMLSDDLTQHHLLGKVLGGHDNVFRLRARTSQQGERGDYSGDNFRSIHPNPPSASSAIKAAGTAPARICSVSTDATPRKIKTPSPPPPMAAAIVA